MKCIYMVAIMIGVSSAHIFSADYYQSLSRSLSHLGQAIEGVNNVPVVGKLTNILPFAILASSLKECPIQTMVVLTALGAYILSYNNVIYRTIKKYELVNKAPWVRKKQAADIDDSFFIYDEEEEEHELMEDELLNIGLFDSEDEETKQRKQVVSI